jgi:hypothetical protein
MSYIGATPAESYASFYVQHFTTSATTSYSLDYPVVNENDLRLVINNVVQQPGSGYSYTAAASTLTLSAATTTSDTMYAVFLGRALQTVNPPGDSVGMDQLAAGTQGDILYYGASGNPALLGVGTSGDFLKTQGAGANPIWASAGGGKINQVVQTYKSDTANTLSTSMVDVTDMSVAITPTAASSTILVIASLSTSNQSGYGGGFDLQRDINGGGYTTIAQGDAASSNTRGWIGNKGDNGDVMLRPCGVFLDEPTWTTGAITYKLRWFVESGGTAYLNRSYGGGTSATNVTGSSSFLAIEVLG